MISPEASDFAWIFVVKPPRERPSACPSCPPLLRQPTHARARSSSRTSGQVRGRTHRGKRVEEGFEDASLAQSVEAFPYAVPGTKAFRQGAPSNVLDREEIERLKEAPVIVALPSSPGKAGAKHRQRVRPIFLIHLCRHAPRPPIRSETYESCLIHPRNPKNLIRPKFVHTT
jgi:hypothetical protein